MDQRSEDDSVLAQGRGGQEPTAFACRGWGERLTLAASRGPEPSEP